LAKLPGVVQDFCQQNGRVLLRHLDGHRRLETDCLPNIVVF
jgi:hypothetical protein